MNTESSECGCGLRRCGEGGALSRLYNSAEVYFVADVVVVEVVIEGVCKTVWAMGRSEVLASEAVADIGEVVEAVVAGGEGCECDSIVGTCAETIAGVWYVRNIQHHV